MKQLTKNQIRKSQLAILAEIHKFCAKNKIKYFLVGGTLIGAVRHRGYIPWDDDIDIAMLRKDYDRFVESFSAKGYELVSPQTVDDYYLAFAKVIDSSTGLKEHISSDIEIGINVDVFPFDNIPKDQRKAKIQYRKSRLLYNLITMKSLLYKKRSFPKQIVYFFGKIITKPLSYSFLTNQIEKNAKKYMDEDSEKVAQVVHPMYKEKTTWPKYYFDKVVLHKFENGKYYIPKEYDKYLKTTYGDYMKLPPKEKRVTHHDYEAWLK